MGALTLSVNFMKQYINYEEQDRVKNVQVCEICGIPFEVENDVEKVVYICDNCKEEEQGDESFAI